MERSLQDMGCKWPECECSVPGFAFSEHNRKQYCRVYVSELIKEKLRDNERYKNTNT